MAYAAACMQHCRHTWPPARPAGWDSGWCCRPPALALQAASWGSEAAGKAGSGLCSSQGQAHAGCACHTVPPPAGDSMLRIGATSLVHFCSHMESKRTVIRWCVSWPLSGTSNSREWCPVRETRAEVLRRFGWPAILVSAPARGGGRQRAVRQAAARAARVLRWWC